MASDTPTNDQFAARKRLISIELLNTLRSAFDRLLLVVTQSDTQALPEGPRDRAKSLIGLVAEEGLEPPTRGL